ncbi:MAG: signal recognition particle-docking protein FtsY [Xanthomonadales bacterium]|nr:signal recognition particle-docking protein FtsY [Xanthomonadales bacterium]
MFRFRKREPGEGGEPGVEAGAAQPPERRPAWRERLARSGIARALRGLFARGPAVDEALFEELETILLAADAGVTATEELIAALRRRAREDAIRDGEGLLAALRAELLDRLRPLARPLEVPPSPRPFVVLVVGVNGAGKTTTIGKLAHRWRGSGLKLLLAAGDTYRAAAVEQLCAWGERNGVPVIAQAPGSDAGAVIFDALQAARARNADVVIADTAGRLHNQAHLMAELGKVRRVIARFDPAAPHETLLVLDGTTGQNALAQLRQFEQAVGVSGLVVTKLDGSAKGGILLAIARERPLPVRFVGLGEGLEDLEPFDPEAFVDGLLPERSPR